MRWGLLISFVLISIIFFITSGVIQELSYAKTYRFFDFEKDNLPLVNEAVIDDFPNGTLFYHNLRFKDRYISYSLNETCDESKIKDVRLAFDILQNETVLNFEEKDKGDIWVSCSNSSNVPQDGFFIAGEGGPTSIINASNFYIINGGTILLYRDNFCKTPIVAIHEILHVLGFKHSSNKKSIMYEVSDCNQRLSPDIIEVINSIYDYPTLPDLTIRKVDAIKEGRFLNFEAEIFNSGLDFSLNSKIGVFADGKLIGEYDIGELKAGEGKIIKVSNLRTSYNFEEISSKVDFEENIFEIYEDNNERILVVGS